MKVLAVVELNDEARRGRGLNVCRLPLKSILTAAGQFSILALMPWTNPGRDRPMSGPG